MDEPPWKSSVASRVAETAARPMCSTCASRGMSAFSRTLRGRPGAARGGPTSTTWCSLTSNKPGQTWAACDRLAGSSSSKRYAPVTRYAFDSNEKTAAAAWPSALTRGSVLYLGHPHVCGPQPMSAFRPCVLVPTYDNPATIRDVVDGARRYVPDVLVVDDGSGPGGRAAVREVERAGLARMLYRLHNGGRARPCKTACVLPESSGSPTRCRWTRTANTTSLTSALCRGRSRQSQRAGRRPSGLR